MGKQIWKPGNMLYPLPAVMVSTGDEQGSTNILTVAWTGTICTNPAMVYISVRPERYSYAMLRESGEFVINLTTEKLAWAADYCGVKSGREVDKWKELHLTPLASQEVAAPSIAESPVNIECKVERVEHLGSHDLFLASLVAVRVDNRYMDQNGSFHLEKAQPIVYSHGEYYDLGAKLGKFGYSIQKNRGRKTKKTQ